MKKQLLALLISLALCIGCIPCYAEEEMGEGIGETEIQEVETGDIEGITVNVEDETLAALTQSMTGNFSRNYSLGSDPAANLIAVARAQLGKTKADLGYTENWCADFVCDCAKLAGIPDNVIAHNYSGRGNVGLLYDYMINNGMATAVANRQAGDLVCYYCTSCGLYKHVGIVVDGTHSYEGNMNGQVTDVRYDVTVGCGHSTANGVVARRYLRPHYVAAPIVNHPVMDINSAQGGPGYIYFRGWAFDADDYTATLLIHVYADGPAGVGTFVGHTWANQSRQDVNSFYGCGEYHGFETQLQYNSPGTHTFYVYSFIPDSGDTTMQTVTATIQQDSSGPAISNIRITDLDPLGYTITCNVEDSSGVTNVLFPTWPTAYTAEEKAIWYQGTVSGNTASCRITFNDFGNLTCRQEFMTHIHALDGPGNRTMINAGVIGLPNVNSILQPASDLGSDFYAVIQNNDSARTVADRMTLCSTGSRAAFWNYQSAKYMWSRMHFVQNSDGSYIIHSTENENLVLDVVNGYTNTGSVLCFAAYHGWQNQRWNIYKENGLYYLVPQNAPQACLDLAYVQTVNDTEAQIYPFNTGGGQGCDLLIERIISYNANGGSVAPASQTFLSGEIVTLPVPTRSGYIFDGWFTSSEGGTKVTSANTVTGNTTLYAHWTLDGIKITKQPADVSTGYGQAVKFNVAVSGNVFSYQWQYSKDGGKKWINCSATAGANTDTLNVKVSASNAATIYHCVIVGTDGTRVISNPAGVQLLPGAVITLNPKSNAVAIGEYAIFIVEAENAASYQWQYSKDGSHWYNSGAEGYKTDTLTVKGSQNSQGNRYRCVVTGIDGNKKKSYMATMIVMTRAPKACTAKVGETASYSLKAEGIESYQWQYSKDDGATWYKSSATGADTDTVTFKATATNRTMIYRCKLTTADGATAFTKPVGFV